MSMIENQQGDDGKNEGGALRFATFSVSQINIDEMDIGSTLPYPDDPSLLMIVINVKEASFMGNTMDGMQSLYNSYRDKLLNHLSEYNMALDMAATNFNAELTKHANIEQVFVSEVVITGDFSGGNPPGQG
jgi:hypothetical protein